MHTKVLNKRKELIGREFETNCSGKCFIIDYKNSRNVTVMFYDPIYVTTVRLGNLERGKAVNNMLRSVYGVGYIGDGDYSKKHNNLHYNFWSNMLGRVYGKLLGKSLPTYVDADVSEGWHNFQNFAAWCETQPFFDTKDDKGKSYHLDKDILVKGNKIYSPETCCFVPHEINSLIVKSDAKRGNYPLGVTYVHERHLFRAVHNVQGKQKFLGYFHTAEEAFGAYKEAKESYIKQVAEKWKGEIDDKVYEALLQWKIEITD